MNNINLIKEDFRNFLESAEQFFEKEREYEWGTEKILFSKGCPVYVGEWKVIPIYKSENKRDYSLAVDKFEKVGYYIPKVGFVLTDYDFNEDIMRRDNSLINQKADFEREVVSKIIKKSEDILGSKDYSDVAAEPDMKAVVKMFNDGEGLLSEEDIIEDVIGIFRKHHDISLSEEELFFCLQDEDYLESKIPSLADYENSIRLKIANNNALRDMIEKESYNHEREVKRVFKELEKVGAATANVTFDFGWTTVEKKVVVGSNYNFLQTGVATDAFQETYFNLVDNDKDGYSARGGYIDYYHRYITKIEYRKKVYFEHLVSVAHVKENELFNLVSRYAQNRNVNLFARIEELLSDENVNVNIKTNKHENTLLYYAVCGWYTTLKDVKKYVEAGCILDNKTRKFIAKEFKRGYRGCNHVSRDIVEIAEYFGISAEESEE